MEVLNPKRVGNRLIGFAALLLLFNTAQSVRAQSELFYSPDSILSSDDSARSSVDILLITFMRKYIQRPIHFFGGIGMIFGTIGLFITGYLGYIRLFLGESIATRPLLLLGVVFIVTSVIMIVQGLIGELITRLLHQTTEQPRYRRRLLRKLHSQPATSKNRDDSGL